MRGFGQTDQLKQELDAVVAKQRQKAIDGAKSRGEYHHELLVEERDEMRQSKAAPLWLVVCVFTVVVAAYNDFVWLAFLAVVPGFLFVLTRYKNRAAEENRSEAFQEHSLDEIREEQLRKHRMKKGDTRYFGRNVTIEESK